MPKGLRGFQKGNKLGKKFEKGKRHWHWNGGIKKYYSGSKNKIYNMIKIRGRYVSEHRYVMEKVLGRKLQKDEVVHHKDGNSKNNTIDNLELMNFKHHSRLTATIRWRKQKVGDVI